MTKDTTAGGVEAVAWIYEDELPSSYPYDAMWAYSEVRGGVRMFPVFSPPATGDGAAYKAEVERVNRSTDAEIGGIDRRFAASPAPAPAAGVEMERARIKRGLSELGYPITRDLEELLADEPCDGLPDAHSKSDPHPEPDKEG